MNINNREINVAAGGTGDIFTYTLPEGPLLGQAAIEFTARAVGTTATGLAAVFESRFLGIRVGAGVATQVGLTIVVPMPVSTLNGGGAMTVTFVGNTVVVTITGDTLVPSEWVGTLEHTQVSFV